MFLKKSGLPRLSLPEGNDTLLDVGLLKVEDGEGVVVVVVLLVVGGLVNEFPRFDRLLEPNRAFVEGAAVVVVVVDTPNDEDEEDAGVAETVLDASDVALASLSSFPPLPLNVSLGLEGRDLFVTGLLGLGLAVVVDVVVVVEVVLEDNVRLLVKTLLAARSLLFVNRLLTLFLDPNGLLDDAVDSEVDSDVVVEGVVVVVVVLGACVEVVVVKGVVVGGTGTSD